jgi:hypothetical protein
VYNLSGAASDVFRRFVTPGFASAWSWVRDLTGRGRRVRGAADQTARAADKRRNLDRWNKAHDR